MLFPPGRCSILRQPSGHGLAPGPAKRHGQTSKDMTKEDMNEVA